jgi:hypothetical protein
MAACNWAHCSAVSCGGQSIRGRPTKAVDPPGGAARRSSLTEAKATPEAADTSSAPVATAVQTTIPADRIVMSITT